MITQFEKEFALEHRCYIDSRSELEATIHIDEENQDDYLESDIRSVLGLSELHFERFSQKQILKRLSELFDISRFELAESLSEKDRFELSSDGASQVNQFVDDSNVIDLVHRWISEAIYLEASDLHFENYENEGRLRFRIDGSLHEHATISTNKYPAVISRLKIMSNLDIGEKRRPQDGRIQVANSSKSVDIRVSIMPMEFGEKLVLRLLDKTALKLDVEQLGFSQEQITIFKRCIQFPYGMILVTGPTGSGKTTTLYSALHALNTSDVNIMTVEDPIEYNLDGINQSQVKADIGFGFAQALRSFLRQDPNIIMLGEIRDQETADTAIRSALTGHLVFSTLHTNDSPSTIARLFDMNIEPFLIASSLRLIMAQRLLRKICPNCKKEVEKNDDILIEMKRLGLNSSDSIYEGEGCHQCYNTGYRGRTAIVELMPIDEELSSAITRKKSVDEIRKIAIENGMQSLKNAALDKIRNAESSIHEVAREIFVTL